MQQVGDVCKGCALHWEEANKEPIILKAIGGTTMNKNAVVPGCSYCDGPLIFEVAEKNNKKP